MTRRTGALWGAIVVLLATTSPAYAHTPDQQPFVKIQGEDAKIYPVGSTSLSDFVLPQDIAAKNYLLGTPIAFQLLTANLPILPENLPKLKVKWEFGDGTSSTELNPTHTYANIGSYTVKLTSTTPEEGVTEPQLLDLILVNIVPTTDYKLPISRIMVDGNEELDAYKDMYIAYFRLPLDFDAGKSEAGTSPIASYLWDFGDQKKGTGPTNRHSYSTLWSYVAVILRVTNKDGLFADSMLQIENPDPIPPTATPTYTGSLADRRPPWQILTALGVMLLGVIAAGAYLAKKKRDQVPTTTAQPKKKKRKR